MKLLCLRIISPVDGSPLADSAWVRVGHEYVVLTLLIDAGGQVKARILAEDQTPSYWAAEMFETSDESLPLNWVGRLGPEGLLEFAPRAWLRRGFWEDYFDGDADARAQYERELSVILGDETSESLTP